MVFGSAMFYFKLINHLFEENFFKNIFNLKTYRFDAILLNQFFLILINVLGNQDCYNYMSYIAYIEFKV